MHTSNRQQQWLISHSIMWGDIRSQHSITVHDSDVVSCWKLAYFCITNQWVRVIFRFTFHMRMISDPLTNLCDNTVTVKTISNKWMTWTAKKFSSSLVKYVSYFLKCHLKTQYIVCLTCWRVLVKDLVLLKYSVLFVSFVNRWKWYLTRCVWWWWLSLERSFGHPLIRLKWVVAVKSSHMGLGSLVILLISVEQKMQWRQELTVVLLSSTGDSSQGIKLDAELTKFPLGWLIKQPLMLAAENTNNPYSYLGPRLTLLSLN